MMRLFILAASAVSVAVTALASATSIGKLTLSGDDTLEVTDKTYLYLLDATADATLTVTGGGDLYVSRILSSKVNFKLVSGRIFVGGELQTPTALTQTQFRLDASKADSLTTETVDDVSYVNTWADANGSNITATAGTAKPYLTTEAGRTWIDFGTAKDKNTEGYGGSMSVPRVEGFYEAYVVACPDAGLKTGTVRTGILTDTQRWTVFMPGSNEANYWPQIVWRWSDDRPTVHVRDSIYQDGNATPMGRGGSWSPGSHFYDFQIASAASTSACTFNTLCRDTMEGGGSGGFRVGEIAIFTSQLPAADREVIGGYLNAKWMSDYAKPAVDCFDIGKGTSVQIWNGTGWDTYCYKEQTATLNLTEDTTVNVNAGEEHEIYELKSDGAHTLTKTGSGVLKIGFVDSSEIVIAVTGGEVVFDDPCELPSALQKDAALWLDAEASDTLTTAGGQVSRWKSANGAQAEATAGTTAPVLSSENGRKMVDFGPCGIASPAYMGLNTTITGVREALLVAKGDATVNTAGQRVSVFGTAYSAFEAGFFQGNFCEIFNRYQIPKSSDHYTYQLDGGLSIDGVSVGNGSGWRTKLACYGFRLTDPEAGGADCAKISSLCNSFGKGGFKVGEVLVFTNQLSAASRALVNTCLKAKWLGNDGYGCSFGTVSVDVGGTVAVPYAVVSAATLRIGGTFTAQRVAAQEIVPLAAGAAVDGVIDLTTPGTVRVDSSVFGSHEEAFKVLSADGVVGSARGWTLTGDYAAGFKLKARADGLYAVPLSGMVILIR